MIADLKKKKLGNAKPQKQEFGSPPLQLSIRCQTHAFFCQRTRISIIGQIIK